MSTYRGPEPPPAAAGPAADDARAAGWAWLATLPRAASAHAERGADPQAAMRGLLAALGDPHRDLRVIHIAGSKGKGSTALLCEALLQRLGQRTLTYTSPHLARWTERLRIDAREADARRAQDALEAVRAAAGRSGIVPGFFEALTATGLLLAARAEVDWAIVEAGVGGRADATNVVTPALAVLHGVRARAHRPARADAGRHRAREGRHHQAGRARHRGRPGRGHRCHRARGRRARRQRARHGRRRPRARWHPGPGRRASPGTATARA
ncbi:MAG: hypothetical protein U5K73_00745 [Halofilum sp. (in: g-proteobacteria)]|nr:hypothetical protein [Halofilum sp. (in: g-proteobacteria)]